jgi:hypothetical protein
MKRIPWRYMFLLGIDPETIVKVGFGTDLLKGFIEWKVFSLLVGFSLGLILYGVSGWNFFNLRWVIVVGVTMAVVELWKIAIVLRIEQRGGLKQ